MFESITANGLTWQNVLACIGVSFGLGLAIALVYSIKNNPSKNFFITLVIIPVIVQAVILMVNDSLGAGIAVMGAFSLVRFRSVPGNSKDICFIFLAMAIGLASAKGQIWFAMMFTGIVCIIYVIYIFIPLKASACKIKDLRITVSEDLNFEVELAEVLSKHAVNFAITKIKTNNMGSLFVVEYEVTLKRSASEKQLIDDLRIRNSNLPISCVNHRAVSDEL